MKLLQRLKTQDPADNELIVMDSNSIDSSSDTATMDRDFAEVPGFLGRIDRWDVVILAWLSRRPWRLLRGLATLVSHTGDGPLYAIIVIAVLFSRPAGGVEFLVAGLIAVAIELPIYFFLKRQVRRARPKDDKGWIRTRSGPLDQFSFPSGHTAAACLSATLLATFFPFFAPWAFAWAALVGMSRLLLMVHFPSDILAGATLGVVAATLSLSLLPF